MRTIMYAWNEPGCESWRFSNTRVPLEAKELLQSSSRSVISKVPLHQCEEAGSNSQAKLPEAS